MAKANKTKVIDNLLYSVHTVSVVQPDKTKKSIGTVDCPSPTSDTLQAYIDAKVLNMDIVCREFKKGYAVTLQAAKRLSAKSGKMSEKDYSRISATFTIDIYQDAIADELSQYDYLHQYAQVLYEEEQNELDN